MVKTQNSRKVFREKALFFVVLRVKIFAITEKEKMYKLYELYHLLIRKSFYHFNLYTLT